MKETLFFPDVVTLPRFQQKSVEWYTPPALLRAARAVLGSIELDPASCELANQTVRASRYYDKDSDGLHQAWHAETVWLNPPYCKVGAVSNQQRWTNKLIAEYQAGHVKQALLLVNAATETRWFERLYAYPVCFVRGRVRFLSPLGINGGSTLGSAVVYFGSDEQRFVQVFQRIGVLVRRVVSMDESAHLWDGLSDVS